jgi:hypothetical protein
VLEDRGETVLADRVLKLRGAVDLPAQCGASSCMPSPQKALPRLASPQSQERTGGQHREYEGIAVRASVVAIVGAELSTSDRQPLSRGVGDDDRHVDREGERDAALDVAHLDVPGGCCG